MTPAEHTPGRLGPYRLLDRIGEGGMGVVYLARDPEQRSVAVKILRPAVAGDPNARLRLAREVETMRRVRSPFVAEVLDTDVTSETPYIVTRYVPGRTLDEVVTQEGPLSGIRLIRLAAGLADALAAIHAAGVVHRDLKPGNVMLMNGDPVVIDFGIAQALDSTRLTMTGMFMGTPGYLSPEVIEGQNSTSFSDVHAWGATVAFAATGRPPFGTGSYETIFYRIATIRLDRPPMNALNAQVQDEMAAAAAQVSADSSVRAVVLYGGPKVFAAGADIREMAGVGYGQMAADSRRLQASFTAVAKIPKPVVAAVTGYALGGGLELALCADFRVAGQAAQVGQPEILLGVIPGAGGTQRLPRLVGPARAKDIVFTGRFVSAAEALDIGLVDRVVPDAEVYDVAMALVARYATGPALALRAAKQAIDDGLETDLDTGLEIERLQFAGLFATEDQSTGMRSFLENGPGKATFAGR